MPKSRVVRGAIKEYSTRVGRLGGGAEDRHRTRREDPPAQLPSARAVPFGHEEAAEAARLYTRLRRSRGRQIDLAIAARALLWDADLWTLNVQDFRDIPELRVSLPS